jgi:hypothetical protein
MQTSFQQTVRIPPHRASSGCKREISRGAPHVLPFNFRASLRRNLLPGLVAETRRCLVKMYDTPPTAFNGRSGALLLLHHLNTCCLVFFAENFIKHCCATFTTCPFIKRTQLNTDRS